MCRTRREIAFDCEGKNCNAACSHRKVTFVELEEPRFLCQGDMQHLKEGEVRKAARWPVETWEIAKQNRGARTLGNLRSDATPR